MLRFLLVSSLILAGVTAPLAGQARDSVWVNTASGVYHCPGTRYYGTTRAGQYMSEREAIGAGHRPANGRACTRRTPVATAAPAAVRVWVNTRSGVYHCPGSRYYGNTQEGRYMTETAARAQGHRPSNNRPCS